MLMVLYLMPAVRTERMGSPVRGDPLGDNITRKHGAEPPCGIRRKAWTATNPPFYQAHRRPPIDPGSNVTEVTPALRHLRPLQLPQSPSPRPNKAMQRSAAAIGAAPRQWPAPNTFATSLHDSRIVHVLRTLAACQAGAMTVTAA